MKHRVWLLAGALVFGAAVRGAAPDGPDEAYRRLSELTRAMEQIRRHYVDADRAGYDALLQGAMRGMLDTLDEHSQYLDDRALHALREDAAGEFGGLGVVVGVSDGFLTVIAPMDGTPAFRAGLLPRDRIVEIDGESAEGVSLEDAVSRMRGRPGTPVRLVVIRPGAQEPLAFELVRAVIDVASVKSADGLEDGIGYVRIMQFTEKTAALLEEELARLERAGLRALVLDLRNNPGGLLQAAVAVSELFLPAGAPIVSTEGRAPGSRALYSARQRRPHRGYPLAVLINSGSASAAEIVSGALRDNGRAVLVGEKTFGKGSVQSVIPLSEETAIRLTTARYLTPGRRPIHEYGIEPDIVVEMPADALREIFLFGEDPLPPDAPRGPPPRDTQRERATDALRAVLLLRGRG